MSFCLANLTFFCFQSSTQILIRTSLCYRNCFLCLIRFFFVHLFTIFISYFIPCFLRLFPFMLFCTSSFHHHVSLYPFRFLNVTPSTVSAVFLSISAVLFHSSGNPSLPRTIKVTSCLNAS